LKAEQRRKYFKSTRQKLVTKVHIFILKEIGSAKMVLFNGTIHIQFESD
jgi:hypothetical protein